MQPSEVNLDAYQGDTWSQTFRLLEEDGVTPIDLTGATIASWAKQYGKAHIVLGAVAGPNPGEIVISGTFPDNGNYEYDVEVTDGAVVTTWIRGTITVLPDVTNG